MTWQQVEVPGGVDLLVAGTSCVDYSNPNCSHPNHSNPNHSNPNLTWQQVEVPGGVDLLVAGTSCVDYSNLNNEKKGLDDAGESGQTFRGMMQWVKRTQPPIVLLENVCSAPWEMVIILTNENFPSTRPIGCHTLRIFLPCDQLNVTR
jgi:site-specific DNA-cytosine methylase